MPGYPPKVTSLRSYTTRNSRVRHTLTVLLATIASTTALTWCIHAQQTDPGKAPVVVQPGAPGQPSKTLPPSTRAVLPPPSPADVAFMQGMIMHHSQAIEMTALIPSHSDN